MHPAMIMQAFTMISVKHDKFVIKNVEEIKKLIYETIILNFYSGLFNDFRSNIQSEKTKARFYFT